MAQPRSDRHKEWARLGALARLQEIEQEREAIVAAFPDLRSKAPGLRVSSDSVGTRRRTISPKGRRAMSAGMRKYWAKRRDAEQQKKS